MLCSSCNHYHEEGVRCSICGHVGKVDLIPKYMAKLEEKKRIRFDIYSFDIDENVKNLITCIRSSKMISEFGLDDYNCLQILGYCGDLPCLNARYWISDSVGMIVEVVVILPGYEDRALVEKMLLFLKGTWNDNMIPKNIPLILFISHNYPSLQVFQNHGFLGLDNQALNIPQRLPADQYLGIIHSSLYSFFSSL